MWLFFGLALIDTPDLIEQKLFSSLSISSVQSGSSVQINSVIE